MVFEIYTMIFKDCQKRKLCSKVKYTYMYVCLFSTWLIAKLIIIPFEYFANIFLEAIYRYSEKNIVLKKNNTVMLLYNRCKCTIHFYYQAFLNFQSQFLEFWKDCNICITSLFPKWVIIFMFFHSNSLIL